MKGKPYLNVLDKYGKQGVKALKRATPVDTGLTADSWYYEIITDFGKTSIEFKNSNKNKGVNIAIILEYGHGTGRGAYVRGRDYINPAIQPIFDKMANEAWKEVTR
jgi:hypothetical protein